MRSRVNAKIVEIRYWDAKRIVYAENHLQNESILRCFGGLWNIRHKTQMATSQYTMVYYYCKLRTK